MRFHDDPFGYYDELVKLWEPCVRVGNAEPDSTRYLESSVFAGSGILGKAIRIHQENQTQVGNESRREMLSFSHPNREIKHAHKEKELSRKRKVRDSNAFPATGNEIKKKARKGCPRADSIKKPILGEHVLGVDSGANTISTKAKEKEVSHKRKRHDKADNSNSRFSGKAKAAHSTPRFPDKVKTSKGCSPAESVAQPQDHSRMSISVTADKVKVSEGNSRTESILNPKDRSKTSIPVTVNKDKGKAREDCARAETGNGEKAEASEGCLRAESIAHPKDQSSTSSPVTGNAAEVRASNIYSQAKSSVQPADDDPMCAEDEVKHEGDCEDQSDGVLEKSGENVIKSEKKVKSRYALDQGDYDAFKVLLDSIWAGGEIVQELEIPVAQPVEELLYRFTFGVEEPVPVEKTAAEIECDDLFAQMEFSLKTLEMGSQYCSTVTLEDLSRNGEHQAALCRKGNHCLILDEEIGLLCSYCRFISQEIKNIIPSLCVLQGKRACEDRDRRYNHGPYVDQAIPEGLEFVFPDKDASEAKSKTNCTIWELIPEITSSMYPHQKEGFEFLWRNIAGSSNLEDLKKDNFCGDPGGCIISHAPGTGKTRLTIVFLMTYMVVFPESKPVVLAPAGMLLSWEDEFKKWNVDIPFHNLNNLDFSGKEDKIALSIFFVKSSRLRGKQDLIRMVKLYSWKKDASILGVSYNLYEKLTWDKQGKKRRNTSGVAPDDAKMREDVKRILLELPGILVLDEGHTPRNKTSSIWQAISQVKTRKRIILSGTPFQNNFVELFNTMSIVRPTVAETLSKNKRYHEILAAKKRVRLSLDQYLSVQGDMEEEAEIAMLKREMAPFVHVHKGSILQERLPGLVDRVLVLDPPEIQKQLIKRIETNKNTFEFEHRVALISTHPALYMNINFSKNEEPILNPNALDAIRLDHSEGVKTRFIVELVHLANALKEKVLVFSQYIDPLNLIRDQIASKFGWREGREILRMQGNLEQRCRQTLIGTFNDPDSEAKVLLASTKACSEGINLVGASRVVLLDVVWNPSVERQAISRAYRLGQKKLVYTYHLIASGTTEWEKYCRQAEKERISQLVFSSANKESAAVVSEDRILEEMISHEKLKDMIVSCHQRDSDLLGSAFRSGLGK